MLKKDDYKDALIAQDACNASGLIHSLYEKVPRIWEEVRAAGLGTDAFNQHPIVRLFAEQLVSLSCGHRDPDQSYFNACQECRERVADESSL